MWGIFILIVVQLNSFLVGSQSVKMHSYEDRRKCSYWQQSGCFLDLVSKVMESRKIDLLNKFKPSIEKDLQLCCCPLPYQECKDTDMNTKCITYVREQISEHSGTISSGKDYAVSILRMRDNLFQHDSNCQKFLATADGHLQSPPKVNADTHKALLCERLTWKMEELGEIDEEAIEDLQCSIDKTNAATHAMERKSTLDDTNLQPSSMEEEGEEEEEEAENTEETSSQEPAKKETVKIMEYTIESYEDRRKCKYWQNSGCLLDVMEKLCESGKSIIPELFNEKERENGYLCCCPMPYKSCKKSEADQDCISYLSQHFLKEKLASMDQETAMIGIQTVRKNLLSKDKSCKYLTQAEPFTKCTKHIAPFTRHDLKCETITWQWEELGDGNAKEFKTINCPFVKSRKATDGNKRKGASKFLKESKPEL